MTIRQPTPRLVQGDEEDILLEIGAILFPGFLKRAVGEKKLWMVLEGDYRDEALAQVAADRFQVLLGVLRAWRPMAGQRADEIRPGVGQGPIRDEDGNQLVRPAPVLNYSRFGGEVESFARSAGAAIEQSQLLRDALWVLGQRDLAGAALRNVYEYAEREFRDRKGITVSLCVSGEQLATFCSSVNNLSPLEGGVHAKQNRPPCWDLRKQREFISLLAKRWIECAARCRRQM